MNEIAYQVVHTTTERVRLRVSRIADDKSYTNNLKRLILAIEEVLSIRVNPVVGAVVVNHQELKELKNAFYQKLFKCIEDAAKEPPHPNIIRESEEIDYIERFGLPLLALSMSLLASPLELPISPLIITLVLAVNILPIWKHTIEKIYSEGHLNVELLECLWLTLHTWQGELLAPALDITMGKASETLRDLTADNKQKSSPNLLPNRLYWVERVGETRQIRVGEIQEGDRVLLNCGDLIPVDGVIIKGKGLIDRQYLTGESKQIPCTSQEQVYASSLLVRGTIMVEAQQIGEKTRAYEMVQLANTDTEDDTRIEDYAEGVSNQVIIPAMALSAGLLATSPDVHRALSPLQLDFGQGIGITVPTTVLAALNYGINTGVYIRSGLALEKLAKIDTVVFDKTGTLTEQTTKIVTIETVNPTIATSEVVRLAACASYYLIHPLSQAIVNYARVENLNVTPCTTWEYLTAMGVEAIVAGDKILVGNTKFMEQAGVEFKEYDDRLVGGIIPNRSYTYVAKNGELLGCIQYTNALRPESATVIQSLQKLGITCYLLTGDNHQVANSVAYKLGIKPGNTIADASVERKTEFLQQLRDRGLTVAYVGEGINDSVAFATADVSVSFADASDVAREIADVILLDNDLRSLCHGITVAREAMEIVNQNIYLVAIPNIAVVLAGLFLNLNPVVGVIINNGASLLAGLNGLRPLLAGDRQEAKIDTTTVRDEEGLLGIPWKKRQRKSFTMLPKNL